MKQRSLMACATRTCKHWVAGAERNCKCSWHVGSYSTPPLLYTDCGFTDLYAKVEEVGNKAAR